MGSIVGGQCGVGLESCWGSSGGVFRDDFGASGGGVVADLGSIRDDLGSVGGPSWSRRGSE